MAKIRLIDIVFDSVVPGYRLVSTTGLMATTLRKST